MDIVVSDPVNAILVFGIVVAIQFTIAFYAARAAVGRGIGPSEPVLAASAEPVDDGVRLTVANLGTRAVFRLRLDWEGHTRRRPSSKPSSSVRSRR